MDAQTKGGPGTPATAQRKNRNHDHLTLADVDAQVRPIAFVNDRFSPISEVHHITFDKLADWLKEPKIGPKDGPAWLPAEIDQGPRTGERVKSVSFLALDVEADAEPVKDENGVPRKDSHGDTIKRVIGPEPPAPDEMLGELALRGWRGFLHTSYSHGGAILPEGIEHPRYRLAMDLSRPLRPEEIKRIGLYVATLLGIADCFDSGCLEPARLFYTPRCPSERITLYQHGIVDGNPLDVDALLADAIKVESAQKSALAKRRGGQSGSVITAFNAASDIATILEHHGYSRKGRRRWIWPGSTTGLSGVRLLPDSEHERIYSSHGGDPLNDGNAHDAFDCWRILAHDGDMRRAVKEAARMLGMDGRETTASDAAMGEHQDGEHDATSADPLDKGWPDPQDLGFVADAEAYPLDALPSTIRAAVEEVAAYTQAPPALVAASALGAVSIAVQGLADMARADKLTGPTSLYLLTIAESGERKSTVDGFFTRAIHAWADEAAAALEPDLLRYRADVAAWEAKHSGTKEAIKQAARTGKATDLDEKRLRDLEHDRPQPPQIPRLTYQDITPEQLAYSLATGWPTAGVLSSEAGTVLGAHGMGKDSMVRNLAFLNVAWEGGIHQVDRRTSESFTVKGARLTMSLAIQDATLRGFFDRTGTLARGTGWMARFLLAWPASTQGTRMYAEAPDRWPALAAFHNRLEHLLKMPLPFDDDGRLQPPLLQLTPAAKAAWINYHDAIESELRRGGELIDVRDVASKSADNGARLAALFHVFEHGLSDINPESFEGAARLAAWHLNESRRYFGEMAQAPELSDAARLDAYLLAYLRDTRQTAVGKRHLQQFGPIRDGRRLDAALAELVDLDRLRLTKDGRQNMVEVNPALLS